MFYWVLIVIMQADIELYPFASEENCHQAAQSIMEVSQAKAVCVKDSVTLTPRG